MSELKVKCEAKIARAEQLFRRGYLVSQFEIHDPFLPEEDYQSVGKMLEELGIQLPYRWPFRDYGYTLIDSILQKYTTIGFLTFSSVVSDDAPDVGSGMPLGMLVDQVSTAGELKNATLLSIYALHHLLMSLLENSCKLVLHVAPFPSNPYTYQLLTNRPPESHDSSWRRAPFYTLGDELLYSEYRFDRTQLISLIDYANANWADCHVVVTDTQSEADWLATQRIIQTAYRPVILRDDPAQPVAVITDQDENANFTLSGNNCFWGTNFQENEIEWLQYIPLQRLCYVGVRILIYYSIAKATDTVVAQLKSRCTGTVIILTLKP